MTKIKCPQCDTEYEVQPDWDGRTAQCQKCSARFRISLRGITSQSKYEPHIQSKKSAGHSSASLRRSSISDLRNQATIISPRDQQTVSNDFHLAESRERVQITLPFAAGGFLATEILAQGGMSITYLGYASSDPTQQVVIKIPDVTSEKTITMFRDECKILESLQHPNIVPILDSGIINVDGQEFPYMVMKYIAGQSLRQQLKTRGKLPWNDVKKILDDVATALGYLYINNFCHRDIKPDNIIFDTETKKWILVDFGIAKSLQDNIILTMTMAGQDSGTWDYMPPEQLDGKAVDIRCDIYALGTVIWEALIGTVPRRGTKLPASYGLDLPEDVDILVGKMVEHNPENRYQTPAEVLEALHTGAKRVEIWKDVKQKTKRISFVVRYSSIIVILLIGFWILGDYITIVKARSIYETHKESATITLRELNKFSVKMPFYWGQRYIRTLIPELENKSRREAENMRREFDTIKNKIRIHSGTDQELEDRILLCNNFLSKWNGIFDTAELRETTTNKNALNAILIRRREEKIVGDTISETRKKTVGGERAKYREALEQCLRVQGLLTLPDTRKKMGDHIAVLKQEVAGVVLAEVRRLLGSNSREDWFTAYQKIDEIYSVIGKDPTLLELQRSIDDKFWAHYYSEAQKAVNDHRFTNAREYIVLYEKTGMSVHKGDVINAHNWIAQAEEAYDWTITNERVNDYVKSNAFIPAMDALERFAKKHPDSKFDVEENRKIISNRFVKYICTLTDLDNYQENMKTYFAKFPNETENIKHLKRILCWAVHNAVRVIMFDKNVAPQAKNAQLAQIKYPDCENYQKDYLKQLISAAQNYVVDTSSNSSYLRFLYYYQRPPADCVKMSGPPTVFWVTITDIEISLSDFHYNALKGMNNCNPEIQLGLEDYLPWWKISGPENTRTFTLSQSYSFWWDTEGPKFLVRIVDGDHSPFDASPQGVLFGPKTFQKSDSTSWNWDNGTTLKMSWITK